MKCSTNFISMSGFMSSNDKGEIECPVCGEMFKAADEHSYKIGKNRNKLVCTYSCECCRNGLCTDCPRLNTPSAILRCKEELMCEALDLINRQQAEIERLRGYNENLLKANTALSNEILDIKAEAVKEFAELLKEHIRDYHPYSYVIDEEVVDNLVKEMVGDAE